MNNEFKQVDFEFFSQVVEYAKSSLSGPSSWRVDSHDAEYYRSVNAKCYVSERGSTLAISEDGAILSLCRHKADRGNFSGADMVEFAKEHGGYKIDCYSGLSRLYEECGFEVVGQIAWNRASAPKDWKPEYGQEDILSMQYYDDFNDLGLGRERVQKLIRSESVYECEKAIAELLNECSKIDDPDWQLRCLESIAEIVEKKGMSLDSIKVQQNTFDDLLESRKDLENGEMEIEFR